MVSVFGSVRYLLVRTHFLLTSPLKTLQMKLSPRQTSSGCTLISDRFCYEHMSASKHVYGCWEREQEKASSLTDKGYHSKNMFICWVVSSLVVPQNATLIVYEWCALCACQKASSKGWHFHHRTCQGSLPGLSLPTCTTSWFSPVAEGGGVRGGRVLV